MWPTVIPRFGQRGLELAEPAQGHTGEQLVAIAKMPIGRGRTDARRARRLRKGKAARPLFGDQVERGPHQGLLEIAVMIAAWRCLPAHVNGLYIRPGLPSMRSDVESPDRTGGSAYQRNRAVCQGLEVSPRFAGTRAQ